MSERKINLEEILKLFLTVEAMKLNNPDYTFNMVLSAMKEACLKTLELAAENAETITKNIEYRGVRAGGYYAIEVVDKQSILNTIKQIE